VPFFKYYNNFWCHETQVLGFFSLSKKWITKNPKKHVFHFSVLLLFIIVYGYKNKNLQKTPYQLKLIFWGKIMDNKKKPHSIFSSAFF